MKKTTIVKYFFLKGKTNAGEFAKQYIWIADKPGIYEKSLIIRKLVYTDNPDMYIRGGFKLLKTFKNKALLEQGFSIKLSTLRQILQLINI